MALHAKLLSHKELQAMHAECTQSETLPQSIVSAALRKLDLINAAHKLDDSCSPPGNRLEALKGNLLGYHSNRVNDQWRITFRGNDDALDVSLVNYH